MVVIDVDAVVVVDVPDMRESNNGTKRCVYGGMRRRDRRKDGIELEISMKNFRIRIDHQHRLNTLPPQFSASSYDEINMDSQVIDVVELTEDVVGSAGLAMESGERL